MKNLKILGKTYTISYEDDLRNNADEGLLGNCSYTNCHISLAKSQSSECMLDTMLHESLHAIEHTVKIGLDEKQVHALAGSLICFMRENKGFSKQIIK